MNEFSHRDYPDDAARNRVTERIIGAAIEVHRALGPGLLESAYVACLSEELTLSNVPFHREVSLPVAYKGRRLDCCFRLDLVVAGLVVVEVKSVAAIESVHEAQLLTYMRLGGWMLGLLINFNVPVLKNGIRRRILDSLRLEFLRPPLRLCVSVVKSRVAVIHT